MNTKQNVLEAGYVELLNLASGEAGRTDYTYECGENGEEFIEVLSFSARDIDPAIAARTSFGQQNREHSEALDLRLLEYLISHSHNTPIEMTETWWEMKLPIFVARQFVRHRTATINEISGRYVTLPEDWYIPEVVGGKPAGNVKQGQEDNLSEITQETFKTSLDNCCRESYREYLYFLKEGVAPEHARLFLHVNHYTVWRFKIDLHNLFNFFRLRLDSHAQLEARAYAAVMFDILKQYLPKSCEFFDTYRRNWTEEEYKYLEEFFLTGTVTSLSYETIKKLALRNGVNLSQHNSEQL